MKNLNLSFLKNLDDEDKILLNRVADWIQIAENKYFCKYSFLLDERQIQLCEQLFASLKCNNFTFYGGYDTATRKVLCVYPEYDIPGNDDFPIDSLLFKYKKEYNLSHRDFLGSLMSLNIARNTIGDIVVGEGCTQVYVYNTITDLIIDNISKIGRVGVSIQKVDSELVKAQVNFEEISGTVASLRIDCVLSLALHQSREKVKAIINSRGVVINHIINYNADTALKDGDIFSVKGFGKFIFKSTNGVSKKNRFHITLFKYL